jgi:hypothetical protein
MTSPTRSGGHDDRCRNLPQKIKCALLMAGQKNWWWSILLLLLPKILVV